MKLNNSRVKYGTGKAHVLFTCRFCETKDFLTRQAPWRRPGRWLQTTLNIQLYLMSQP
ncbi:hypothetical protein WG66_003304 [Moniliophthora roreri]|nr:hypothetical protein WG66_003304 [Moniliophthora roreri]